MIDSSQIQISKRQRIYIGVLLLLVWEIVAWVSARALVVDSDLPQADVLVILGGSASYIERSEAAVEILKTGRVKKIILTNDGQQSGWSNAEQRNPLFVERAFKELQRQGIPDDKIEILPNVVSSTRDEAVLLRTTAAHREWHSLLILTSPYHSRRAFRIFRHEFDGSGVLVGLTSVRNGRQTPSPWFWWLSTTGWKMVAGEYVKLIYYQFTD
ncbi:MAG TPA: YdcF family protein [Pyrinomonadaceae bacterium]|nr:YdcF family protein [Pyrinomonadaceae bacterium]